MITEDYVSFETAKLLKEKGFDDEYPNAFYDKNGDLYFIDILSDFSEHPDNDTDIAASTLYVAMKWLREVQALNIYARPVWKDVEVQYGDWEPAVVGYNWLVESLIDGAYSKMSIEPFLTYEEACETAIKYCLENLI